MSKFFLNRGDARLNIRAIILNIGLILLIIYFSFHSLSGNRGLFAYLRLQKELASQQKNLAKILYEKALLERRVSLLKNKNLDLDLLDELARRDIGLIGEKEFIFQEKQALGKSF